MSGDLIRQLVAEALEVDLSGDQETKAYKKYHESMMEILIAVSTQSTLLKTEKLHLFMLAQSCVSRMQELCKIIPEDIVTGDDKFDVGEDSYLQFATTPTVQRSSSHESQKSLVFPGTSAVMSKDRSQSLSTPVTAAVLNTSSRPSTPPTDFAVTKSLNALRKIHEGPLVAKQKEYSARILQEHVKVTATNQVYVSKLLQRRQQLYSSLNERLSSVFGSITSNIGGKGHEEYEKRRKNIGTSLRQLQASDDEYKVIPGIIDLLSSREDPVAVLVRDFVSRCQRLLQEAATFPNAPAQIVDQVLDEVSIVEHHLVDLILSQYPDLREYPLSVKVSIQSYLFSTPLSPAILAQLRRCSNDIQLANTLLSASWQDLFTRLHINNRLQLPRDQFLDSFPSHSGGIYHKAIEDLRTITACVTPVDKALAMVRSCNAICNAVTEECQEEGGLGSEDLLLLTAYVLVKSGIPDISSQMTFVGKLIPEELVRGETGYVLATMQTALDYAMTA